MFKTKKCLYLLTMIFCLSIITTTMGATVFYDDFNIGVSSKFSGITTSAGVGGYDGIGSGADVFSGKFLVNSSTGNPASNTTLELTGLAPHTSVNIDFLLAIIDTWDGTNGGYAPDYFNVKVDGNTVFSHTFDHFGGPQTYTGPALVSGINLYGGGTIDSAYDIDLSVAHTSSTLTIDWFASGSGWQGSSDEYWALDNVKVAANGTPQVPEPSTMLLLGSTLLGIVGFSKRKNS